MGIPQTLSQVPGVAPYAQYIATNGQTVFPYPFPITQDSDLVVVVNGVTLSTDQGYSLSGQGAPFGGNVTFAFGQAANAVVTLYRNIEIERISQIAQNSGFSSTTFNAEFNNIYLILQQLELSIGQCLQIPTTNNPAPVTILTPGLYANKYLGFDANGNPTPVVLTSSGALTQAIIAGILTPQTQAESNAGITPINLQYAPGNMFRYYTAAQITQTASFSSTPVLDCSAAINNAIKATTGDVFFPTGIHYINAPIYIPTTATANVRFVGESRTNTQIQPMANNIADQLGINAMIINQANNEKFSMYRIRCTVGGAPALQTAWAGFSLHAAQPVAWSSSTTYVAGAIVTSGGNTYVCTAANTNQLPPNASFWTLCAANAAGYTAANCNYIFSGSIRDCWFDAGGVQPFFVGGLNNFHVTDNTFEFCKGCFSITGGTADAHFISNSMSNCFDYFINCTMTPNANIISVRGLHVYTHNRGLLFQFISAWNVLIDGVFLQAVTGGSNLGSIGIGSFVTTNDLTISNCSTLTSATLGTGTTSTILTFQACTGQVSNCTFDGCDVGLLLTGTAANQLSFDQVDIINTNTAAFRVQTGTPSGLITVSNSNWSNCNGSNVLFSSAGAFDFYMSSCTILNGGLTAGSGARNLNISTTRKVVIRDCVIGQNNAGAGAGFYIEADGAGAGDFTVIDPTIIGSPVSGLTTGSQTVIWDGVDSSMPGMPQFVPSLGGSTTYTAQSGTWSIKNKTLHYQGHIIVNAIGTGSASTISGLPFASSAAYGGGGGPLQYFTGLTGTYVNLAMFVDISSSQIKIRGATAAASANAVQSALTSSSEIIFSGSYRVYA